MNEHETTHVTPKGRSVFEDLLSPEEAAEIEMRAALLRGLEAWLAEHSNLTQTEIAKQLNTTQARVSDIKRGQISKFSLDMLVKLAARAGLHPRVELAA